MRRIVAIALALAALLALAGPAAANGVCHLAPGPSAGTRENPLLISSESDLHELARPPCANFGEWFRQTADIALTFDLQPIGGAGNVAFRGHYDGGGHSITGISYAGGASQVGLFGLVEPMSVSERSTISNLEIAGSIAGADAVGGLVGYATGLDIANVTSRVDVTASAPSTTAGGLVGTGIDVTIADSSASGSVGGALAGGLVGSLDGAASAIDRSSASGAVLAAEDPIDVAGGLVGLLTDGDLADVRASGLVTVYGPAASGDSPTALAGGLIGMGGAGSITRASSSGYASATSATGGFSVAGGLVAWLFATPISDAVATGAVSATVQAPSGDWAWAGGVIGARLDVGPVTRVYATGAVTTPGAPAGHVGGLIGVVHGHADGLASAYWSPALSGVDVAVGDATTTGATALTATQMIHRSSFAGWDVRDAWRADAATAWAACGGVEEGRPFLVGAYAADPCTQTASARPGTAGYVDVAGTTVSWAADTFDVPVTIAISAPMPNSPTTAGDAFALRIVVRDAAGRRVTRLPGVLTLDMAPRAGGIPAWTRSGRFWTAAARCAWPTVTKGFPDCWMTAPDGSLVIVTRHLTTFASLAAGTRVRKALQAHLRPAERTRIARDGSIRVPLRTTLPATTRITITTAAGSLTVERRTSPVGSIARIVLPARLRRASRATIAVVSTTPLNGRARATASTRLVPTPVPSPTG